jgi:hypothetical protein
MKKIMFIILLFCSAYAMACEYQLQGNGSNNILGDTNYQNKIIHEDREENIRDGNSYDLNGCGDGIDLPPMVVSGYYNPGPSYFWMGSARFYHYSHGGSGGGTPANSITPAKLKFCELKDNLNALVSALPVIGTANSGYSVAQSSLNLYSATIDAGFNDIVSFIRDGQRNPPQYTGGIVDWYTADIDWNQYNSWQSNPPPIYNQSNSYPTKGNGGALNVFANFLHQIGQGSGNVDQLLADKDPQPEIDC